MIPHKSLSGHEPREVRELKRDERQWDEVACFRNRDLCGRNAEPEWRYATHYYCIVTWYEPTALNNPPSI